MKNMIGLKEWSSVVDAIGHGKQTVIVRGYEPKVPTFFLYPTYSFYVNAEKDPTIWGQQFQTQHVAHAKESGARTYERGRNQLWVDIDYYVTVQQAVWVSSDSVWRDLEPFYIWNAEHVIQYAKNTKPGKACLWLIRAFRLAETKVLGRTSMGGPPSYHQHPEAINSEKADPILTNAQYTEISKAILKILG